METAEIRFHLKTAEREIERLQSELADLRDHRHSVDYGKPQTESQIWINSLKEQNRALLLQVDGLTMEKASLQGELAYLKNKGQTAVDPAALNRQIAILQGQLTLAEHENAQLRESTAAAAETYSGELEARDTIIRKLKKKLDGSVQEKDDVERQKSEQEAEIVRLTRALQQRDDAQNQRCEKAERHADELSKRYKSLYSKYKVLKVAAQKEDEAAQQAKAQIDRSNERKNQKATEDQICSLTVQRQQFEGLLHVSEEKLAHEQAKSQEMRQKLDKADAELQELRCFMKVMATNERQAKKFGAERDGIIDELQNIGGKIDRVQRVVLEQREASPRRSPVRRRPVQTWRGSGRL
jgi:chromosome segregation ATPase